jgi:hypothetical protein
MFEDSSESLHLAIRRALTAGEFETARRLSDALGQAIIREARAVAPVEREKLVESGLDRLREHVNLAHVASQLQANTTISLYQDAYGRSHSWRFDG